MSLIDRIKSALGVGEQSSRNDTRVKKSHNGSAEHSETENGEEQTATTQASSSSKESETARETVQATNAGTTATETQTTTETNEQSSTAGGGFEFPKSGEQTELEIETEAIESEPEELETETEQPETEEAETTVKETETEVAEQETDTTETITESVDVIKGVGASYSERLAEAGIETVDDLSGSDPEAVADETGLSEKRLERWVGRAEHRE